ncbi:MAG: phosphotransferase family protein [Motilibacteraceae bacterium]
MPLTFVKRRDPAPPGSIPDVLQMFVSEVRFYREVASHVGVRVPVCFRAEERDGATLLELEDLSAWTPGADPAQAAQVLAGMHRRWDSGVAERWPWLRRPGAAVDLVAAAYDRVWPQVAARPDLPEPVRPLGARLVGRLVEAEAVAATAGPLTLIHGDAALRNMRTGPDGEIALLDWEDVGTAPGITDLAQLLLSSVDPDGWDATIAAYGSPEGLSAALPAACAQGIFTLSDTTSEVEAHALCRRLEEAAGRTG